MQRNLSSGMINSTNSNNCTPQQKLRKISFHTSDFDDYLNSIPNMESESVEGWSNQTWNLKNSSFNLGKTQTKGFWANKNSESPKKSPISGNHPNEKAKYIQKLEQKLIELVNIKKERQAKRTMNETTTLHYLTPRKQTTNEKRTTSTSQSECEKYEHNFTSTSLKKEFQRSPMLKVRKPSRQFAQDSSLIKINPSQELKLNLRTHLNRSMLTSYEPMSQRSKEISIIAYPVLDSERKPRVRKLSKLQDFKETFYFKQNPEYCLQKQGKYKNQTSSFKIKVSEPKVKQEKGLQLNV